MQNQDLPNTKLNISEILNSILENHMLYNTISLTKETAEDLAVFKEKAFNIDADYRYILRG